MLTIVGCSQGHKVSQTEQALATETGPDFALPADRQVDTPGNTLPPVTAGSTINLHWRPSDTILKDHRGALPGAVFAIVRVRPGKPDVTMNTRGSAGRNLRSADDACRVQIKVPDEPGEYRIQVRNSFKPELFSETTLRVQKK